VSFCGSACALTSAQTITAQPQVVMAVVFWDVETTGLDPDAAAMTVGCVLELGSSAPKTFHSGFGKEMTAETAVEMLEALEAATTVVTFNGAAFDFRFLATATDAARVAAVARKSIDLQLCSVAVTGCVCAADMCAGSPRSGSNTVLCGAGTLCL
jgi:uncharacterized protein YprB with RNaseH-like and TPR domain